MIPRTIESFPSFLLSVAEIHADTLNTSVLVSIWPESSLGDSQLSEDLLYVSGNADILVGDGDIMRLGQFPGALLLLPSIEVLADGISRMRTRQRKIEVILVGDTPSMWLVARKIGMRSGLVASYRGAETGLITSEEFDVACEGAVAEFFAWVCQRRPFVTWSTSATQIAEAVARTWPRVTKALA